MKASDKNLEGGLLIPVWVGLKPEMIGERMSHAQLSIQGGAVSPRGRTLGLQTSQEIVPLVAGLVPLAGVAHPQLSVSSEAAHHLLPV